MTPGWYTDRDSNYTNCIFATFVCHWIGSSWKIEWLLLLVVTVFSHLWILTPFMTSPPETSHYCHRLSPLVRTVLIQPQPPFWVKVFVRTLRVPSSLETHDTGDEVGVPNVPKDRVSSMDHLWHLTYSLPSLRSDSGRLLTLDKMTSNLLLSSSLVCSSCYFPARSSRSDETSSPRDTRSCSDPLCPQVSTTRVRYDS